MNAGGPGSGRTGLHARWWTVAALLIPAVIRCSFLQVDQVFEAHTMALDLLATGQFGHHYFGSWDRCFQFPVYTTLLAVIYGLGGGAVVALWFQVACGTVVAYLAMRLVQHLLHGRPTARAMSLVAAWVVGLDPFLAYYQVRMVHPFAWDMLLAAALLFMALTVRSEQRLEIILFFALGGLAVLNRPTLGVFMFPFILRHPRYFLRPDKVLLKSWLLVLLFGPIACWVLRNHALTGRAQLTSVTDQMLWMGQQEETEGGGYQKDGTTYLHLLSIPERHRMFTADPAERSWLFRAKWRAERESEPGLAWRMFAVKWRNFWWSRSSIGQDHAASPPWAMQLYRVHAALLLLLFVASLFLGDRRVWYIGLSALLLSVAQCVYYFETRHRLLIDPVLIALALVFLSRIGERIPRIGRSLQ